MPTFNNQIDRTGADALIPEEIAREIIQGAVEGSAALQLLRRLPNMTAAVQRQPVLASLPMAYFVTGDTGMKQTTQMAWDKKYLYAEEIAVIVPIPENVLADATYDIWGEVRPRIIEAIGAVIDGAIMFGTNAPALWPTAIVPGAIAAGQSVALGTGVDLYDDLLGEGGVISLLEADGFRNTGSVADVSMLAKLRGTRDANGNPIWATSMRDGDPDVLNGRPIFYPLNGAFEATDALLIAGSWNEAVFSIRQDVSYKMLTEAVITDADRQIIYNLPQQDMVALRVVMRLAWQIPNPIKRLNTNEATRYPFAVLTP